MDTTNKKIVDRIIQMRMPMIEEVICLRDEGRLLER